MSKKKNKKSATAIDSGFLVLAAALAVLIAVVLVVLLLAGRGNGNVPSNPTTSTTKPAIQNSTIDNTTNVDINLGYGMEIVKVAKYTGIYMEDGTDDIVSGLLMIVVKNTGDTDIQYAEIEMPVNDKMAFFKLTTLPAGESMVVLEQNRMEYVNADIATAISKNVVLFDNKISLCEDTIKLSVNNGSINFSRIVICHRT